jgi:hypothetical protein
MKKKSPMGKPMTKMAPLSKGKNKRAMPKAKLKKA